MFIDGHKVETDYEFETDVCIIGGGPAGITLACEFAKKDFKVVLLESGGKKFRHPSQWLNIAYNVGRTYFDIVFSRHRMLGGSTYKWYGLCRPLDPLDFKERPWVPYSGWPYGKSVLDPFYDRACKYFQLPTTDFSTENFLEPNQTEIQNERIVTKVYQFSPPTDFSAQYADAVAGAGNVDIIYHANVIDIDVNEDGKEVRQVKVVTLTRKKFRVSARIFILACGGIENARLLLVSNSVLKDGLGNQNDLVGRFFNEHPHAYYAELTSLEHNRFSGIYNPLDYKIDAKNLPPTSVISLRQEIMCENQLMNACAILVRRPLYKISADYNSVAGVSLTRMAELLSHSSCISESNWQDFKNVISQPAIGLRILREQFKNKMAPRGAVSLRIMVETAPNPDSRITISERRDFLGMNRINLDWCLTNRDLESSNSCRKLLFDEIKSLGYGVNEIDLELDDSGWPYAMTAAKHHMGTTRMHSIPKKGVVDPDCKVHGIENLYVTGSSVFPTSGCANPTFTIIALTLKLADHIKGIMEKTPQ
jgi:choline dehydrogenase-like flavoprotein